MPVKIGEVIAGYATVNGGPEIVINITNREIRTSLRENMLADMVSGFSFDPEYVDEVLNNMKEYI